MRNIILIFLAIYTLQCNSQTYRMEVNNFIYEGFVDSTEMKVTFYIASLSNLPDKSIIKLYIPDITLKTSHNQVVGYFKNIENELLMCKKFKIIEDFILIEEIDYRKLLSDKYRALRLCFEFLPPMYFIFIDWK